MKKFVFRLETVLDMRRKKEEEVQIKLGEVLTILNQEMAKLEALFDKRNFYQSEITNMKPIATKAMDVMMYQDYLDSLENTIKQQKEIIRKVEKIVEEVRMELAEAAKSRKIIEKIKENEYEEYMKEFEASERSILDEFGVIAVARKMNTNQ
ncbi:MAG: flagellar export protein FliJ [Firmicutes bacterium]|nr:flagellar export protein FliJ [Bacillota bacterium]